MQLAFPLPLPALPTLPARREAWRLAAGGLVGGGFAAGTATAAAASASSGWTPALARAS